MIRGANTQDDTYTGAGFNRFFRRSIDSDPMATTLRNSRAGGGGRGNFAFDQQQISGMLGDILKVGSITINGKDGRIEIHDDIGTETGRIGKLDD